MENNDENAMIYDDKTQDLLFVGVRAMVDSLREILPTNDDYEGGKSALLRLQKAYELNVADVINGTILGMTTRPMTQQMAVDVALFALDAKLVDDALLWFMHAQKHPVPPMIPLQDIYHTMSRIHAQVEVHVCCIYLRQGFPTCGPRAKRRQASQSGLDLSKKLKLNYKPLYENCKN